MKAQPLAPPSHVALVVARRFPHARVHLILRRHINAFMDIELVSMHGRVVAMCACVNAGPRATVAWTWLAQHHTLKRPQLWLSMCVHVCAIPVPCPHSQQNGWGMMVDAAGFSYLGCEWCSVVARVP